MKFIHFLMNIIIYTLFDTFLLIFIAAGTSSFIAQYQSLSYGNSIVSSPRGTYELGFFNLGYPNKIYLGIRYKNIPTQNVVWVANGGNPINDSSTILKLNSSGNLVLTHNNMVVWSTSSRKAAQNPVAELLDSGNLVIREKNEAKAEEEQYLWQSFDYPSDTMLAGTKVGWDLKRNFEIRLVAWKSFDDPTPGDLSWGVTLHPYPEFYMMKGTKKYHRLGPWNGLHFSGRPEMAGSFPIYHFDFVSNKEEVYYTWTQKQTNLLSKLVLNQTTKERPRYVWSDTEKSWMFYTPMPEDYCDHYGVCGANSYCSTSAYPMCECLKGFKPKSPEKWNYSMGWTEGCVLKHPLSCKNDGFLLVEGLKVPDTKHTFVDESIDLEQCKTKCLNDCSCMAYTNSNISGAGSGCVMWFGDLIDIKLYPVPEKGQDLYIRLPPSELESIRDKKDSKILIFATSIGATLGVILAIHFVYRRNIADMSNAENNHEEPLPQHGHNRWNIADKSKTKESIKRQVKNLDVPLFDLLTITIAANNFSSNNKIGQGGFGPVYKGKLVDGRDIAVKRLSSRSGQGIGRVHNRSKTDCKASTPKSCKAPRLLLSKTRKITVI